MPPPPAPSPPPSGGGGIAARFTRKVGPLPVWGWAALILGAYLLYARLHPADTAAAEPVQQAGPASDEGAQVPASGTTGQLAGPSEDLIAQIYGDNAATIDTLTNALLTQESLRLSSGVAPGSVSSSGEAAAPAAPATAATAAVAHQSQPQAGLLRWDGQVFATQAGFRAWAKAHGTSPERIFRTHPRAKAIFSTLR